MTKLFWVAPLALLLSTSRPAAAERVSPADAPAAEPVPRSGHAAGRPSPCEPRGTITIIHDEIPEAPPIIDAPWMGRDRVLFVIPAGDVSREEPAREERSYFPRSGEEAASTSPLYLVSGEARASIPPPPVPSL